MEPTTIYLYSPRADVYSENGNLRFELLFDLVIFLPQTVLSNGMHHASYLVQCEYIPKFQCLALSLFFIFTVKDIAHFLGM